MATEFKDILKVNNKNIVLSVNEVGADDNGNVVIPSVQDTQIMTTRLEQRTDSMGYFILTKNGGNGEIGTGNIEPACYLTYTEIGEGQDATLEPVIVCRTFRGRLRGTATMAINDENGNSFVEKYVRNDEDVNITGSISSTKSITADRFITSSGIEIL